MGCYVVCYQLTCETEANLERGDSRQRTDLCYYAQAELGW